MTTQESVCIIPSLRANSIKLCQCYCYEKKKHMKRQIKKTNIRSALTKGSKCYIINLNEIYGQRKKIVCVCIFCQTFVSFWNQKVMSNLGTTAKGWISNKFGSFHAAWKSSWASKQTHFSALLPPETSSRLWPTFSSGSVEIHPL